MESSYKYYWRLLGYMKPYKARFALGLLLMAISSATEPLIPVLLKPLLDGDFNPSDGSIPWMIGVALVFIVFFRGIVGYWSEYFMNWLSNQVVLDLRRQMFERILAFPAKTMDASHSSQIINKVINDVGNVMGATTTVLTSLVRDSIALFALLAWLLWLNWQLTLVFFVVVPIAVLVIKKFNVLMRKFSIRSMEINANILQILQESVEGYRMVKIFGGQKYERQRFEKAAQIWKKQQMRIGNAQSAVMPVTQTIASVALAFVIVMAAHQAATKAFTVGEMMSYLTAALMTMPALRRISSVGAVLQRGIAAAQSVFSLIDKPIEDLIKFEDKADVGVIHSATTINSDSRMQGIIEFKNLSFYYPEREISSLKNINLKISAGESVALVGASGAGKSTIAALICAFYRDYDGSLTIDGEELAQINLYKLRQNLAIVTQEVKLFDDTVRANIAYGELVHKSEEEIIAAAQSAFAMEFINELPQGINTNIGERGIKLSGGQRQRLAIARAILKNAPILILDEATSALDSQAEVIVQKAINNLMQNRTTIIIAHRLATISKVSRIIILEQGAIVEEGSHQKLIEQNGIYYKYYQMQTLQATKAGDGN